MERRIVVVRKKGKLIGIARYGVRTGMMVIVLGKMDKYFLLLYGLDIEEEIKLRALDTAIKCSKTCSRTEFMDEQVLGIRTII